MSLNIPSVFINLQQDIYSYILHQQVNNTTVLSVVFGQFHSYTGIFENVAIFYVFWLFLPFFHTQNAF